MGDEKEENKGDGLTDDVASANVTRLGYDGQAAAQAAATASDKDVAAPMGSVAEQRTGGVVESSSEETSSSSSGSDEMESSAIGAAHDAEKDAPSTKIGSAEVEEGDSSSSSSSSSSCTTASATVASSPTLEAGHLGAVVSERGRGEEDSADTTPPGRKESQHDDENGALVGDEGEGGTSERVVDVAAGVGGVAEEK